MVPTRLPPIFYPSTVTQLPSLIIFKICDSEHSRTLTEELIQQNLHGKGCITLMDGLALPWGDKAKSSVDSIQEPEGKEVVGATFAAGKRIEVHIHNIASSSPPETAEARVVADYTMKAGSLAPHRRG